MDRKTNETQAIDNDEPESVKEGDPPRGKTLSKTQWDKSSLGQKLVRIPLFDVWSHSGTW